MSKPIVEVRQRIERRMTVKVTGQELIDYINQELKSGNSTMRIPDKASVVVAIPGGGDWSNTELDIDERTPVAISWLETEGGLA